MRPVCLQHHGLALYTFAIDDPGVWLSVVLLPFVGIVVGQLTALQRSRAGVALAREREAHALFQVSRPLVTRTSTRDVLAEITRILRQGDAALALAA